jgi:hypothetical protein
MAQVFSPTATLVIKLTLGVLVAGSVAAAATYRLAARSDPGEGAPIEQPIAFSHQHHVRDDGLDCRFCHVSAETSRFAGIPTLATCMTCHSQLFTQTRALRPLVSAYRSGERVQWNRVHELPDFAYFDHSIHLAKGVGCTTCHGPVDRMPLTWRYASLDMQWCLDCHRAPERYLRPLDRVFDVDWTPPPDQASAGKRLRKMYHLRDSRELTDCSTCHR